MILDYILSSQRPSSDRSGLGFVRENKPESFSVTNEEYRILKILQKKSCNSRESLMGDLSNKILIIAQGF